MGDKVEMSIYYQFRAAKIFWELSKIADMTDFDDGTFAVLHFY